MRTGRAVWKSSWSPRIDGELFPGVVALHHPSNHSRLHLRRRKFYRTECCHIKGVSILVLRSDSPPMLARIMLFAHLTVSIPKLTRSLGRARLPNLDPGVACAAADLSLWSCLTCAVVVVVVVV